MNDSIETVLRAALAILLATIVVSCRSRDADITKTQIVHTFSDEPPLYASPKGIAFDRDGNLFVSFRTFDGTTFIRNAVIRFTSTGARSDVAELGPAEPGYLGALGLTTDSAGNVYVAFPSGNDKHGVWKIAPDGQSERLPGSERIHIPNALTFDDRGILYATDCYPADPKDTVGSVWRYARQTGHFETWARSELLAPDPLADPVSPPPPAPPLPAPGANGIAFAPPNYLYVANTEKCLILRIAISPDGSAGEVTVVAGAYPPAGPPGLRFAPDGLAVDARGNIFTVLPPAGFTRPDFPLSPVIRIDPKTGVVESVADPIVEPSPLFDFPTSLAFGTEPWDEQSLFVVGITAHVYGTEGSGPKVTRVRLNP